MEKTLEEFITLIESEMGNIQQQAITLVERGGTIQAAAALWKSLADVRKEAKSLLEQMQTGATTMAAAGSTTAPNTVTTKTNPQP
jgi:hypothetical protein